MPSDPLSAAGAISPPERPLPAERPLPPAHAPTQPSPWGQPSAPAQAPPPPNNNPVTLATNVNVTTDLAGPTMVFTHDKAGPGFFIRALWYVSVGWWAAALAILVAYVAMVVIVGIPVAFAIFNRLPTILTLRPRSTRWSARTEGGVTFVELGHERQSPWRQRAIYFLLVGWWFGAVWLSFAWAISIFIVTLPLTFWMFNRTAEVMTLHRN